MDRRSKRRRGLPHLLALALLLPCATAAAAPRPHLDTRRILDLATRWMKARPKTRFGAWDPTVRKRLLEEARAMGEPPPGSLDEIVHVMWKAVRREGPHALKDAIETPYGRAWWIRSGRGGPHDGLLLGLHGGGVGAGSASEPAGTWKLPKTLQFYPQGIRLIHDTWNSVHGERFLLTLIEIAKAQYDIDPDRVYVTGFSMGGTGSMFMAGHHPDLLAGAIPAHGVIAAQGGSKIRLEKDVGPMEHGIVPNLRNLAVYFYTGSLDDHCEPGTFLKAWTQIRGFRKDDPRGYRQIAFTCYEGMKHAFAPGEPTRGLRWLRDKRRVPFPERVVWEYNANPWPWPDEKDEGKATRLTTHWMYWLYCKRPADRMRVTATRHETKTECVFDLDVLLAFPEDFAIYLNDTMADPAKEVVVRVGGKEVWRGRPKRGYDTILESLDAKLDRTLVFDRKVEIPGK